MLDNCTDKCLNLVIFYPITAHVRDMHNECAVCIGSVNVSIGDKIRPFVLAFQILVDYNDCENIKCRFHHCHENTQYLKSNVCQTRQRV